MIKSYPLLKPLTDQLMKEVRAYGILEVSLEQYQIVCNSIVRFVQSSQVDSYSPELMDSYKDNLDTRCSSGEICKEYHRFQLRVMRMLSSLAESGIVDFSSTKSHPLKYIVSDETSSLVEIILNSYPISNATKKVRRLDFSAPSVSFMAAPPSEPSGAHAPLPAALCAEKRCQQSLHALPWPSPLQ